MMDDVSGWKIPESRLPKGPQQMRSKKNCINKCINIFSCSLSLTHPSNVNRSLDLLFSTFPVAAPVANGACELPPILLHTTRVAVGWSPVPWRPPAPTSPGGTDSVVQPTSLSEGQTMTLRLWYKANRESREIVWKNVEKGSGDLASLHVWSLQWQHENHGKHYLKVFRYVPVDLFLRLSISTSVTSQAIYFSYMCAFVVPLIAWLHIATIVPIKRVI